MPLPSLFSVPTEGPATPTEFATRANDSFDAIKSGFRADDGNRPSWLPNGGFWVKVVSATAEEFYRYDGTSDVLIGTFDPTNHTWTPAVTTILGSLIKQSSGLLVPAKPVVTKAANYTAVAGDRGKLVYCSGALTLSLTAAATLGADWFIDVRAAATVTIYPSGSEQINGSLTLTLQNGESARIICDGSAFHALLGRAQAPSGGQTQIGATANLSGGSSAQFTSIPQTYSRLVLIGRNVSLSGYGNILIHPSVDNGASYDATGANYDGKTGTSYQWMTTVWAGGNFTAVLSLTAANVVDFDLSISNYQGNMWATFEIRQAIQSGSKNFTAGYYLNNNAINALRLACSAGTFDAGTLKLYGVN